MSKQTAKKRCTAVVLAAGSGSRMQSKVAKQYMLLAGKPVIWYALNAVEQSEIIDDCVLVAGADDIPYVRAEIVEKYGFAKVDAIAAGGAERYSSVGNALRLIAEGGMRIPNRDGYIFIHDGARPFLTEDIIRRTYEAVREHHACVAAMPSKDTIKIADEDDFSVDTPDRRRVWSVQTPQVFDTELIVAAYEQLRRRERELRAQGVSVTDDAGVVELFSDCRVKMVEGSYRNLKITTPEDIRTAEAFLQGTENF